MLAANSAARQAGNGREEDRFSTSEIVEHRGDVAGPLLHGRQCILCDGIGAPVSGWSMRSQPAQRRHRLQIALNGGYRKNSQQVNQFGQNTMSRGPSGETR